jgi:hypothetical protein
VNLTRNSQSTCEQISKTRCGKEREERKLKKFNLCRVLADSTRQTFARKNRKEKERKEIKTIFEYPIAGTRQTSARKIEKEKERDFF